MTPKKKLDKNEINYVIQSMILNPDISKEQVLKFVKNNCRDFQLTPRTLGMLFEEYAGVEYDPENPTSCFSREIPISELVKIHPSFESTNGNQWARSDNSYLGKKYIIKRPKKNGKVHAVKLDGPNDNSIKKYRNIRKDIKDEISKERCVILDISTNIEVDHKNGFYNDLSNIATEDQKKSSFQPLTKTANMAKKGHCIECKNTGKRYDARRLGYKEGWVVGDENTKQCTGCYWYDPKQFNELISKDFKKEK